MLQWNKLIFREALSPYTERNLGARLLKIFKNICNAPQFYVDVQESQHFLVFWENTFAEIIQGEPSSREPPFEHLGRGAKTEVNVLCNCGSKSCLGLFQNLLRKRNSLLRFWVQLDILVAKVTKCLLLRGVKQFIVTILNNYHCMP